MIQAISSYMQRFVSGSTTSFLIDAEEVANECFVHIFHRLDNETLLSCMLTCHRFHGLIENSAFWVELARHRGIEDTLPPLVWRKVAHQKKFKGSENGEVDVANFHFDLKKMVLTGSGYSRIQPKYLHYFENVRDHIVRGTIRTDDFAIRAGGDGIELEMSSGVGCEPHPSVSKCLAFSYVTSSIHTYIDLVAAGIDPWVLDYVRPKIRITQKINHRHDCAASLSFAAQLNYHETQWIVENGNEQTHHDCDCKRYKSINKQWQQWVQATWEDVSLEFDGYPSGMRHLTVMNSGNDGQFWRGFYGPKIANVEIQVILPEVPIVRPFEEDTEKRAEDEEPARVLPERGIRVPMFRRVRHAYGMPPAPFIDPNGE